MCFSIRAAETLKAQHLFEKAFDCYPIWLTLGPNGVPMLALFLCSFCPEQFKKSNNSSESLMALCYLIEMTGQLFHQ